jgi:hypothetical protein
MMVDDSRRLMAHFHNSVTQVRGYRSKALLSILHRR